MQRIQTVGDKSVLSLKSFHAATATGIYQCFAQNEYGFKQVNLLLVPSEQVQQQQKKVSQTLDVSASTSDTKRPLIIMGPQNTTIYEGQSVVLLCVTNESGAGTQINWLQNDLIIEPTLMRRFEINQLLGNLRIVSIQRSDAGIYKCIASNEYGMSTAEAFVQVKSASGIASNPNVSKKEDEAVTGAEDMTKLLLPQTSRPIVQQIGSDKILLKWHLSVDSNQVFILIF